MELETDDFRLPSTTKHAADSFFNFPDPLRFGSGEGITNAARGKKPIIARPDDGNCRLELGKPDLVRSGVEWGVVVTRWVMSKGGIFEAGFGEILCFPHLQWAGKRKFASRFTKPSLPDPTLALGNEASTLPNVSELHQRFGNWGLLYNNLRFET